MRAIVAAGLAGCAYQPGSFQSMTEPLAGQRATIGCLDVAVDRRPDLPDGRVVLAYAFGNRCDHPTVVDLASVAMVGRGDDGRELRLVAFDPRREMRPLELDSCAVGRELIAYRSADRVHAVCVDTASIAHAPATHWVCVTEAL
jgi:hypothetical protein